MLQSKLIKGSTLFSFLFFIATFLLYRTGKLDGFFFNDESSLQSSSNGGAVNLNRRDSLIKKDSIEKKLLIDPVYRSMLLLDQPNREMMSSSKSAIVFIPKSQGVGISHYLPNFSSITKKSFLDSVDQFLSHNQTSKRTVIPSSKSGIIFPAQFIFGLKKQGY